MALNFGGERDYIELGSYRDVVWSHKEEKELVFCLHWTLPDKLDIVEPTDPTKKLFSGKEMSFEVAIDSSKKGNARVKLFKYIFSDQCFSMIRNETGNQYKLRPIKPGHSFRFIRTVGRKWDLPQPIKFHGFPTQVMTYFQNTDFLGDLQRQLEEQFFRTFYLGPLREPPRRLYVWSGSEPTDVGRQGERTVDALLAKVSSGTYIRRGKGKKPMGLQEMVASWLKKLKLIHDFSVNPLSKNSNFYEVRVQKSPEAAKVLLTDVGFGVSQILPILVLCYYVEKGSTILLEQPEIHLHPSVQMGLADVFIDVIKNRKVQIILESHSEHLLNRLQRRIADQTLQNDDVALYFCETKENTAKLRTLKTDLFGNIENQKDMPDTDGIVENRNVAYFQIFFIDRAVIVFHSCCAEKSKDILQVFFEFFPRLRFSAMPVGVIDVFFGIGEHNRRVFAFAPEVFSP